jgi:atypical dual specificity phosphatase
VRGVINLCEEYPGPMQQYHQLGIKSLHLPTVDHFEPSVPDLELALHFIQQFGNNATTTTHPNDRPTNDTKDQVDHNSRRHSHHDKNKNNNRVYIHCRAGHGRSAAVVMAYLISKDPKQANLRAINQYMGSLRNVRSTLWQQPNIIRLAQRLKEQQERQQNENKTINQIVSEWDRIIEDDVDDPLDPSSEKKDENNLDDHSNISMR